MINFIFHTGNYISKENILWYLVWNLIYSAGHSAETVFINWVPRSQQVALKESSLLKVIAALA
jgi:hypothetical protein